jgi:hypothetical protein
MVFLVLVVLVSTSINQSYSEAPSAIISGSFQLSFQNLNGASQYTIFYSYPKTVDWGSNLTITTTVTVNELNGAQLYLINYGLTTTVYASNGRASVEQLLGGGQGETIGYLYAGAHWGPVNITVPVNEDNFGNISGQSMNASISVQFIGDVQYGASIFASPYTAYQSGSGNIGNVSIVNVGTQTRTYLYVLIGVSLAIVIVAASSYFVIRRKRGRDRKGI